MTRFSVISSSLNPFLPPWYSMPINPVICRLTSGSVLYFSAACSNAAGVSASSAASAAVVVGALKRLHCSKGAPLCLPLLFNEFVIGGHRALGEFQEILSPSSAASAAAVVGAFVCVFLS